MTSALGGAMAELADALAGYAFLPSSERVLQDQAADVLTRAGLPVPAESKRGKGATQLELKEVQSC